MAYIHIMVLNSKIFISSFLVYFTNMCKSPLNPTFRLHSNLSVMISVKIFVLLLLFVFGGVGIWEFRSIEQSQQMQQLFHVKEKGN